MTSGDIAVRKPEPRSAAELRATLAETEEGIAVAGDAVRDLDDRLEANAAAEAAVAVGELTVEEVAEQRTRLLQEREAAREELRRLEAAAAHLPGRIAQAEQDEAGAEWFRLDDAHAKAARERDEDLGDLGILLEPVIAVVDRVEARRARYERAAIAAEAPPCDLCDEPDVRPAGWERLAAFLAAGPRTPAASDAARASAAARRVEDADLSRVKSDADYVADYLGSDAAEQRIAQAPERLRDRIRARAAEIRAERVEGFEEFAQQQRVRALIEGNPDPTERARLEAELAAGNLPSTDASATNAGVDAVVGETIEPLEGEEPLASLTDDEAAAAGADLRFEFAREGSLLLGTLEPLPDGEPS